MKALITPAKKRCYKCGKTKLRKSFYADSRRHDGLQSRCKDCNHKHIYRFKCPNCGHEFTRGICAPHPCNKCWRVAKPILS